MSKSKSKALLLTFTIVLTGLSSTSLLQVPQAVYSQTDYEEYLNTETNTEQELNQQNVGSGSSTNINCGTNMAGTNLAQLITCPSTPVETPTPDVGHVVVIKNVINDDGSTSTARDFTISVSRSFPGAESPGTNIAVSPGAFSVSETGPSGYTQSLSGDCSGTINAGDRKVCTITNNDKPQTGDASITVRRVSCTSETSIGLDITVSIPHDSQEIPFMLQYYLPSGNLLRVPQYTVPANAPDPFIAGISDVLNLPPGPTAGTYKIIMVVNYDYDNAITTTFQVPECSQL
jgi:hypothetical protein